MHPFQLNYKLKMTLDFESRLRQSLPAHQAVDCCQGEQEMDKPRHPNVIRTWNMRRPVPNLPSVKNEITRQIPVRGVPQPQNAPASRFESREALGVTMSLRFCI
jgi:hypothetical protein